MGTSRNHGWRRCGTAPAAGYAAESLERRRLLNGHLFSTVSGAALFADAALTTPGATGTYVNASLRGRALQDDWRVTQSVAGTRVDAVLNFPQNGWGSRASVGLTGGTDANWDDFSVQWDGYLRVDRAGTRVSTRSDDGSRLWVDLNNDGAFNTSGSELLNNNWGSGQGATAGPRSIPLAPGAYKIRVQYEEGNGGNVFQLNADTLPDYVVRVAYVVPSNRTAQPQAVPWAQAQLAMFQNWFRDQMERNGFGPKTFVFETQDDGVTPQVHTVPVAPTDADLRTDPWGRVQDAAGAAGVPLWSRGQVWLVVPETQLQQPDGSIIGGVALGLGGSGNGGGLAMAAYDGLKALDRIDDRPYAGQIIPEIGPYPLVQDLSFPWFEGTTISGVSSSHQGAMMHELGHALGLPHDFRNDDNFRGGLMGNGLRGFRGAMQPSRYGADDTYLSHGQALVLNGSRYFNAVGATYTDDAAPSLSISTPPGAVAPAAGLLPISFTASDPAGLASAWLLRDGNQVGEMALGGTSGGGTFQTPYYTAGTASNYEVAVFDAQGNRASAAVTVTPSASANRAPQPFVKLSRTIVAPGAPVTLDAGRTSDPDGNAMTVRWDLDGNGTFDTAPSSTMTLTTSFAEAGTRRIRALLTDSAGAAAHSAFIGLRVQPRAEVVTGGGGNDAWFARGHGEYVQVFTGGSAPAAGAAPVRSVLADAIDSVTIDGAGGDDTLTVDHTTAPPVPAPRVAFNGGAGAADRLRVVGNAATDSFALAPGQVARGGRVVAYAAEALTLLRGSFAAASDLGPIHVEVGAPATLAMNATQHVASLTIAAGGTARVPTHGARQLVLDALAIAPGGRLDLADNAMVLTSDALPAVRSLLVSGFNGGDWLGSGVTSSAAAGDTTRATALGYATAGQLGVTEFLGVTGLSSTDVIVRQTYYGDTNLDRLVNTDDVINILAAGKLDAGSPADWFEGDFTFDNLANTDDIIQLLATGRLDQA